jgi:hypothetical protein
VRIVTLRDEGDGLDTRHLEAYLDETGNLHIDGQDLGPSTSIVSGDGEYEWHTTMKAEYLPRLRGLLGATAEANLLDVLQQHWSGDRAGDLETLIRDSDIPVERSSWSG